VAASTRTLPALQHDIQALAHTPIRSAVRKLDSSRIFAVPQALSVVRRAVRRHLDFAKMEKIAQDGLARKPPRPRLCISATYARPTSPPVSAYRSSCKAVRASYGVPQRLILSGKPSYASYGDRLTPLRVIHLRFLPCASPPAPSAAPYPLRAQAWADPPVRAHSPSPPWSLKTYPVFALPHHYPFPRRGSCVPSPQGRVWWMNR